jgi:superfamily II DNA/RNA helicase
VFNFDVPHHAEDYVHRSGRTGRAGREGHAYTLASPEDRLAVEAIEKLTGGAIPRIVVPGLDVVQWAEGSSRPRRGRGGAPSRSRGGAKADEAKPREEKPREQAPRRAKTEERPARAPRTADRAPHTPTTDDRAPRPASRAAHRPDPVKAPEPVRSDSTPSDRKWREDDLGPDVAGFGSDVPAFMMLPKRATRGHAAESHEQDEAA